MSSSDELDALLAEIGCDQARHRAAAYQALKIMAQRADALTQVREYVYHHEAKMTRLKSRANPWRVYEVYDGLALLVAEQVIEENSEAADEAEPRMYSDKWGEA